MIYKRLWKNVNELWLKELSESLSMFLYHFCSYLDTKIPMCFIYGYIVEKNVYVQCTCALSCMIRDMYTYI